MAETPRRRKPTRPRDPQGDRRTETQRHLFEGRLQLVTLASAIHCDGGRRINERCAPLGLKRGVDAYGDVEHRFSTLQLDDRDWLEREYVEGGRSSADIARELKCGKTTVRDALRRHGVERRPRGRIPKEDVCSDQMAAMRARGLTLHAIASELGVSVSTVWRRLAASPEPRD